MSRFQSRLHSYARKLLLEFENTRATLSDSGLKGGQNEKTLAVFLQHHVPAEFVRTKVQILDIADRISDEVDVCVCNQYQPFRDLEGALLIAEGVDFVVQVKAILDQGELERTVSNCATVKALDRSFLPRDRVLAPIGVRKKDLGRLPYCVFAFSSQLSPETLDDRLEELCKHVPLESQPDAVFVLDRGVAFINFRDGQVNGWKSQGKPFLGWAMVASGDDILADVLRFAYTQVPRFVRNGSPLLNYFVQLPDRVRGRTL